MENNDFFSLDDKPPEVIAAVMEQIDMVLSKLRSLGNTDEARAALRMLTDDEDLWNQVRELERHYIAIQKLKLSVVSRLGALIAKGGSSLH